MPEGPSILIASESMQPFVGRKILTASGNASIDISSLNGKKLTGIKTWGKQLFLITKNTVVRIHFLLFGSYSINNNNKPVNRIRLQLRFSNGVIFFYSCSVKIVEDPTTQYDWKADVLSDDWDGAAALRKLSALPKTYICDALLNQDIFSGVGNIIKNEVLYRVRVHPESSVGKIPVKVLRKITREARKNSFDFLEWKLAFVLKKHLLVHTKKICKRCALPIIKKYCGKTNRRTFFCNNCQVRY